MKTKSKKVEPLCWALCLVLIVAFCYLQNKIENYDAKAQQDHYCEMVLLWKDSQGENGHPDYAGTFKELCK